MTPNMTTREFFQDNPIASTFIIFFSVFFILHQLFGFHSWTMMVTILSVILILMLADHQTKRREYCRREEEEREVREEAKRGEYSNSIGMKFALIPAGEFEMGSPLDGAATRDDEGPVHRVKIEKAFYMGRYEVTQKEWREVMGNNPSRRFKGDDLPVGHVSWDDVQEFIQKLNEKEGTDKYRLPSEAEWEYACRAGTTTRYSFGDSESKLGDYAWYDDNSGNKPHPVGMKLPNPWGLYDMHGNVWEWVQDKWYRNYDGAPTDGSAWESGAWESALGADRVIRGGGCWGSCLSSFRTYANPHYRRVEGFRLLKEL